MSAPTKVYFSCLKTGCKTVSMENVSVFIMFYLNFFDGFVGLEGNIGDTGVHHQPKQIQNEVGVPPKVEKGCVTLSKE